MPTQAEQADLSARVAETGAQILLWEGKPPEAAFTMARDLGLQNIVFSPLAHGDKGRTFLQVYEDAVSEMSRATPQ